jgi:hypothetical protein
LSFQHTKNDTTFHLRSNGNSKIGLLLLLINWMLINKKPFGKCQWKQLRKIKTDIRVKQTIWNFKGQARVTKYRLGASDTKNSSKKWTREITVFLRYQTHIFDKFTKLCRIHKISLTNEFGWFSIKWRLSHLPYLLKITLAFHYF